MQGPTTSTPGPCSHLAHLPSGRAPGRYGPPFCRSAQEPVALQTLNEQERDRGRERDRQKEDRHTERLSKRRGAGSQTGSGSRASLTHSFPQDLAPSQPPVGWSGQGIPRAQLGQVIRRGHAVPGGPLTCSVSPEVLPVCFQKRAAEHKCLGGGAFGRGLAHSKVPRSGAPCTPTWRGSSTTFPQK